MKFRFIHILIVWMWLVGMSGYLGGCVLPYTVDPDIKQDEMAAAVRNEILKRATVLRPVNHDGVRTWEQRFIANIEKKMQGINTRIDIVDSSEFWRSVFTDQEKEHKVESLFEDPAYDALAHFEIDYLILITVDKSLDDDVLWVPGLGGSSGEKRTKATALIIDWNDQQAIEQIYMETHGHELVLNVMFYVTGYTAATEMSMKSALSEMLANELMIKKATGIIKIVMFEQGSGAANLSIMQKPAYVDDGRGETELQFYWDDIYSDEALTWLCRAADQGNPAARYRFGLLYEKGAEGLPQDLVQSYVWYRLSESNGVYMRAGEQAVRVLSHMTAAQAMEAERLIRDWQPGTCEKYVTQATGWVQE